MVFDFLRELRQHMTLVGFMVFALWLAFLTSFEMIFGWGGAGDDLVIPPSPVIEADAPETSGEESARGGVPQPGCLNVEGTTICLEE